MPESLAVICCWSPMPQGNTDTVRNVRQWPLWGGLTISVACLMLMGLIGWIAAQSLTSSTHVYTVVSQTTFTRSRTIRAASPQRPIVLHKTPFMTHGGTTVVEWYDGARSPLGPKSGSDVALSIDGHVITATLNG